MKIHVVSVHEKKTFKCEMCGYICSRKNTMKTLNEKSKKWPMVQWNRCNPSTCWNPSAAQLIFALSDWHFFCRLSEESHYSYGKQKFFKKMASIDIRCSGIAAIQVRVEIRLPPNWLLRSQTDILFSRLPEESHYSYGKQFSFGMRQLFAVKQNEWILVLKSPSYFLFSSKF